MEEAVITTKVRIGKIDEELYEKCQRQKQQVPPIFINLHHLSF